MIMLLRSLGRPAINRACNSAFTTIRNWQVDAFTSKAFQGNPADVVYLPNGHNKSDLWLQQMASESHIPITSFVTKEEKGKYSIRWFTPTKEIELCGHGTIAAAHVLYNETKEVSLEHAIHFTTKYSGTVSITHSNTNSKYSMELMFPNTRLTKDETLLNDIDIENLAKTFHITPETLRSNILFTGLSLYDLVLEVSPSLFHSLPHNDLDFSSLMKVPTSRGVIITSVGNGTSNDFVLRMFLPKYGINEDHVSGSAYCALAEYWDFKLRRSGGAMIGYQQSKRGGEVRTRLVGESVALGGDCVTTKVGHIVAQ